MLATQLLNQSGSSGSVHSTLPITPMQPSAPSHHLNADPINEISDVPARTQLLEGLMNWVLASGSPLEEEERKDAAIRIIFNFHHK